MSLPFYLWSRTAASNATADPTVNWAEGQAPSSVNDSGRAMMASSAAYRDDNSGQLQTGGTSTAYTLSTFQVFDTTAHMSGASISFYIHATNGASPTLNVDGLGAFPITLDLTNSVPAGTLIAGSNYTALFAFSASKWVLQNFYSLPFVVPIGGMIDFTGSSVPNSNFVFPTGQAISRTTYSTLFSSIGTTYGTGDGSTTFNVPDITGRVVAMKESSSSRLTTGAVGLDGATLGAATLGGNTIVTANLPPYTPAGSVATTVTPSQQVLNQTSGNSVTPPGTVQFLATNATATSFGASSTFTGTAQGGTSALLRMVQPTIVLNKILRII